MAALRQPAIHGGVLRGIGDRHQAVGIVVLIVARVSAPAVHLSRNLENAGEDTRATVQGGLYPPALTTDSWC